jgi:hypothetical protein
MISKNTDPSSWDTHTYIIHTYIYINTVAFIMKFDTCLREHSLTVKTATSKNRKNTDSNNMIHKCSTLKGVVN